MPTQNQPGGASGSVQKSAPRQAQQAERPRDLLDLLRTVQTFYTTPELNEAIRGLVDDPLRGIPAARSALHNHFKELLFEGTASSAVSAFDKLTTKVSDLEGKVSLFLSRVSAEDVQTFLVPGALKSRYEQEHPDEKQALAKYIAGDELFFPKNQAVRAFIQASVTSIHLAKELSRTHLYPGGLFVTNSVVLPLILLQGNPQVCVYTLCGTEYDNRNGGWLPRTDDTVAHEYLKDLFTREEAQVQDAYVTPTAVNCDDGELLFTRHELKSLIDVAVKHATRLIILTLSSRLLKSKSDPALSAIQMHTQLHPLELRGRLGRPLVVIAHDPKEPLKIDEYDLYINKLRSKGFEIHLQGHDLKWRVWSKKEVGSDGVPNGP